MIYSGFLPFSDVRYDGMTKCGYTSRVRLHGSQTRGNPRHGLDAFHVRARKRGAHKYLFHPLIDLDRVQNTETKFVHLVEVRTFLLLRVTENTQNQSRSGREKLDVIH